MLEDIVKKMMNHRDPVPSLRRLTLLKVAVALCSQEDIGTLIVECIDLRDTWDKPKYEDLQRWRRLRSRAAEGVSRLLVPETLRVEILDLVCPVCLEVIKWLGLHSKDHDLRLEIPLSELRWTGHGRIDKRHTAQSIVRDDRVPLEKRYKLACLYCLEADIHSLWEQMPTHARHSFRAKDVPQHPLVVFWTHLVQGACGDDDDPAPTRRDAFLSAAGDGNRAAAEFFFLRSGDPERREFLRASIQDISMRRRHPNYVNFRYEDFCDVFYFIICRIGEEEQVRMFASNPFAVLRSFLCRPLRAFPTDMVGEVGRFLSEREFAALMSYVLFKYLRGYSDHDYTRVFAELWVRSSVSHRNIINRDSHLGAYYLGVFLRLIFPFISEHEAYLQRAADLSALLREGPSKLSGVDEVHCWFLRFLVRARVATQTSLVHLKNIMARLYEDAFKFSREEWEQRLHLIGLLLDQEDVT